MLSAGLEQSFTLSCECLYGAVCCLRTVTCSLIDVPSSMGNVGSTLLKALALFLLERGVFQTKKPTPGANHNPLSAP